jgi:hypothetical protein
VSNTAANLLSGLIGAILGAIVGGALSLAGSIIVNRRERRTALRHQLYLLATDLAPRMEDARFGRVSKADIDDMVVQAGRLLRLGAIAGGNERRLAAEAADQWLKARNAGGRQDLPDMTSHLTNASNALDELLELLQRKLD